MTRRLPAMLAGSSLLVIASTLGVQAQTTSAPRQVAAAAADADAGEEIVVTARRKAENLLDVPQTVTAVTANEVQKLNMLSLEDIGEVVSGLQIAVGALGDSVSTRGVTFNQSSQTPGTVAQYINEAPEQAAAIFQSIYDIGQIEVLKGPQGTARGISTPSGAITLTTKRPDLDRIGGYAEVTVTDQSAHNLQAAVSFPIVLDKLAIRIAGVENENEGDEVKSVNSKVSPNSRTDSARVSLRFEPNDSITANVMYQHLNKREVELGGGVFGPGSPGGPDAAPNYNGPPLGMFDRETAATIPNIAKSNIDFVTGQFDWAFAGQKLSYVGSYTYYDLKSAGDGSGSSEANTLPNFVDPFFDHVPEHVNSHELRLQSVDRIAGMFDYVAGVYHSHDATNVSVNNGPIAALPGFFGAPGSTPSPFVTNGRYAIDLLINAPTTTTETSEYANITAHIGDKFEIAGGARHIAETVVVGQTLQTASAFTAAALPAAACAGAGGQFGATYAGVCDIPVPGGLFFPPSTNTVHDHPWVWDVSASYHINPDLMVYAHAGSSFLPGHYVGIGIENANNDPTLNSLTALNPETSKSYEGGVKWSFLDHRGRLSLDYYHQDFSGLFYFDPSNAFYYTGLPAPNAVSQHEFTVGVPAKVDGVEADLAMDVTKQWSVGGNFSYADGRLSGSIPCSSSKFNGVPDTVVPPSDGSTFIAAGKSVAFCPSNASTSTAPKWNFNIQSEYSHPVTDQVDAYIRGLFNYQPRNPNAQLFYVVPAYGLLNLYIGVRDPNHRWDVMAFAKNLANVTKVTSLGVNPVQPFLTGSTQPLFGASGYTGLGLTAPREFGLTVRYSFGAG